MTERSNAPQLADFERDEFGYRVWCLECGEEFHAKRYGAKFCSATCRQRAHRAKDNHHKVIAAANDAVTALIEQTPVTRHSLSYDALAEIARRAAAGLLAAGLLEAQAPERCPECGAEPVGGEAYCWECWCNGFGWPE